MWWAAAPPIYIKPLQPPWRAKGKAFPLWWLAPPPLPRWEACHWILSRPRAPYESSSLATPQAGAQQPVHNIEPHMILQPRGALLSHRSAGGRWCRKAPKGEKPPKVANHQMGILLMIPRVSKEHQKGCISDGRQPGLPVFYARRAVVWFSFREAKL